MYSLLHLCPLKPIFEQTDELPELISQKELLFFFPTKMFGPPYNTDTNSQIILLSTKANN